MSDPQANKSINMTDILVERVRAGQPIYVAGPLEDVSAKLHATMVNRLMTETGLPVTVIHTLN